MNASLPPGDLLANAWRASSGAGPPQLASGGLLELLNHHICVLRSPRSLKGPL